MEIQAIRELLRQGQSVKALEALIALIERDSRFKDNLLRTLRVTEANLNAVRQQELKGILPFQEAQREYARATDTLLAVLDDVEAGRVPAVAAPLSSRNRMRWIFGSVGALLLLSAAAFWLLRERCPEFSGEKNGLKVLIFEFQPVVENAGERARPGLVLRERIEQLAPGKIPVSIALRSDEYGKRVNSFDAALKIGKRCGADLVVWGVYQSMERDSFRVKIRSQFTREGGTAVNTEFRPLRDLASLANKNDTFREFDDAFFSLCAMVAIERDRWVVAQRWLKRIKDPQPADMAMQEMVDKRLPGR